MVVLVHEVDEVVDEVLVHDLALEDRDEVQADEDQAGEEEERHQLYTFPLQKK